MSGSKGKVVLAMSGGVDSSVAAALLKDDGYEVVGCFMRLGSPGESIDACDKDKMKIGHQGCCSIEDATDAKHVAAKLNIPLYVLNFKDQFGRIIDYFVAEYNAGRTPNPCVRCNNWLKFGHLMNYAKAIDADYVATGHYARIESIGDQPMLLQGVDQDKDQSYVLFGQSIDLLKRILLPVGRYHKSDIRRMAHELDLPVHDKPDSQEICFVPDMDYAGVIRRHAPNAMADGDVLDMDGNVVGRHEGHQNFTIGQRRGVGVAMGYPIYVVNKDASNNTITVGLREDLSAMSLVADQVNWLVQPPRQQPINCTAKIRYNHRPIPARVLASGEDELTVWFNEAQFAVAPGQVVVCYDGQRVLGGGWIR